MDSNGAGLWDWRKGVVFILYWAIIASPFWFIPMVFWAMGWKTAR